MANIDPTPSWADIRRLETTDRNMAGPGGILNDPTTSIAARLNLLRENDTTLGNSVASVNARQDAADTAIANIQGQVLNAPGTLSDLENGVALDPVAGFHDVPSVENTLGPVNAINESIESLAARTKQLRDWRDSDSATLHGIGGAETVGYQAEGAGAIPYDIGRALDESFSVLQYGAVAADDVDAFPAIQALLDHVASIGGGVIHLPWQPKPYRISNTLKLWNDTTLICGGWLKIIADTEFDAAVSGVPGATGWRVYNLRVDANNIPAQGGLYLRRNNAGCYVDCVEVINAVHDTATKGGRAVCIEAGVNHTLYGTRRSYINTVIARNCYNALTVQGGSPTESPNWIVGNVIGENCQTLVNIFGNTAGYPFSGDKMQGIIGSVTGFNCGASTSYTRRAGIINSDRGCNISFGTISVVNTPDYLAAAAYPPHALFFGDFAGCRVVDAKVESDLTAAIYFTRFAEENSITGDTFNSYRNFFRICVKGVLQSAVATTITAATKVQDTSIDLEIQDAISGATFLPAQMQTKDSCFLALTYYPQKARVSGTCLKIGATAPTKYTSIVVNMNEVFNGAVTYDAPSLAPGAAGPVQTTTVAGATVGAVVESAFAISSQGLQIVAWVSAADTVSWFVINPPANPSGTIDLASTTVRIRVRPPAPP